MRTPSTEQEHNLLRIIQEADRPRALQLVASEQIATGAVLHVYERTGDLKYGEVEVGEETVIFDADSTRQ